MSNPNMTGVASIYIPRMSSSWTESSVRAYMRNVGIGKVSHVDFTAVNKRRGFSGDVCSGIMSAFVHFSDPFRCADGDYYWSSNSWNIPFWTNVSENNPTKLKVNKSEYWWCFKNTNPVNRSRMNIHQVVDNCKYLEELVASQAEGLASQAEGLASQAEEIATLKKSLDGVTNVVYQLVGGLFNQRTQADTITHHLNGMSMSMKCDRGPMELGELSEMEEQVPNEPLNIWPTTRQGDKLSKQIQDIEQRLQFTEGQVGDLMELESCFGYTRSSDVTSTLAAAEKAYK